MEADDGALLADRQGEHRAGDLAAQRRGLEVLVHDAHRHHGPQLAAAVHRLGAGHQPGPERPGDGREHHVVDGAAVEPPYLAVVVEPGAHGVEPPLLRQRGLQRRVGHRPASGEQRAGCARVRRRAARKPRSAATGFRICSCTAPASSAADDGSRRGIHSSGMRSRATVSLSRMTWPRSMVEIPSTRVWWDLARIANRPLLQPLDEVHLPQRPGAVQRSGDDARHELLELLHGARAGQRRLPHVVGEVEVVVVDPDRPRQAAGDRHSRWR